MNILRRAAAFCCIAAFASLVACSGSGGSSPTIAPPTNNPGGSPPSPANMTISSPPITTTSQLVHALENVVNGDKSWYASGTTAWNASAGDTSTGGNGSNTIDAESCSQMAEPTTQLHVHAFVGLYVNGTEEAIPSALGIYKPTEPTSAGAKSDSYAVLTAQCYYHMHTHDYSGLIHIEDSTLAQSWSLSSLPAYAKLKTMFDIWGEALDAQTVASFSGSVAMYVGTPSAKNGKDDVVKSYTPFNGDLRTIQLGHHEAVWIVVGTPPAGLPQVEFDIEN